MEEYDASLNMDAVIPRERPGMPIHIEKLNNAHREGGGGGRGQGNKG